MDDASRLITCYGTFDRPTTENAISVLEKGFKEYGIPDEILTDLGTQFVAPRNCEESRHTFKEYLPEKGIRHIVGGVRHLQMNGKIGRFFREGERRVQKFGSVERVVHWQSVIQPLCVSISMSPAMSSGTGCRRNESLAMRGAGGSDLNEFGIPQKMNRPQ